MRDNKSEKVSVNMNIATLSEIDLLVDNGYYSNRSDFINQAVRSSLQQHQSAINRIIECNTHRQTHPNAWFVGISGYTAEEIRELYDAGEHFPVKGYGMLVLDPKCDEEKLFRVIESICVKGKVVCTQRVRDRYGLK